DWMLTQDMANPRLWIESYEVPTWVDYVRFHSRTTYADAHVGDHVRALHRGEWPPNVRRRLIWKASPNGRGTPPAPTPTEIA
ncbi:MAG TPA: MFS transporter, partial [Pseudomonadales bacterium]|nr:MFS transporter [Pseudomonadales bacterium]